MEALKVLEDKINVLLEKVNELAAENKRLIQHNEELEKKCTAQMSELDSEKEVTKTVIDDLIKSIDSLV